MACYIDNPNCLVFKSTNKYEVEDPAFQCFAQVTPKTYDQIPATNDEESKETLKHEQDEFAIQQFTDNINMGLGSYQPRFLTRKLPYGFHGFEVACLNIKEGEWTFSENLIKILYFDEDCNQVNELQEITEPEPDSPVKELSPVKIDRET